MSMDFKLSTDRCIFLVWVAFTLFISFTANAQEKKPSTQKTDSLHTSNDSTSVKKNKKDSLSVPVSSSALKSEVKYKATDSIIYDVDGKKVYLYGKGGKAHVDYTDIKLDASFIKIDYTTNTIFAKGLPDSAGKVTGKPIFAEGKDITNSDSMVYNFKTKRGKVFTLLTAQGEGFVHVQEAKTEKIDGKDVIFARNAKYTTCNLPDDPHFYLASNRMKLMPNDKVVTGPAWIVVEGVPLPIILPFGFFPASSHQASGLILPSYGESQQQGFVLKGLGYYWNGNDHIDAAIKGDIYTEGGYKLELTSRYKEIYKYAGNFDISYAKNQVGAQEDPRSYTQDNYSLTWTHNQDVKASPGERFSASVNAQTPGFSKINNYDITAYSNQTLSSSINYQKQFLNTPFNLNITATHAQNLGLHTIDFSLPTVNFSMNRINPFKSKTDTKKHWYDEISIQYTGTFTNRLNTHDSTLKNDIFDLRKYNSGFDNEIPISASFKVLKYFTFTPGINNSIYVATKKYVNGNYTTFYDPIRKGTFDTVVVHEYEGLYVAHTHNVNASLGTTVYGMYKINKGRIIAFRHVMTPSISAVYSPDYSLPVYGYYGSNVSDAYGTVSRYSYYGGPGSVLPPIPQGRQGTLSFSLGNNFELKVKTKKDTVNNTKKIKILDNLNFSGSYNFLADSMKLSPIGMSLQTTFFEKLVMNGGATLSPYYYDNYGLVHKEYDYDVEHKIGRITNANLSLSTSLNRKKKTTTGHALQPAKNPFVYYNYPQPYASFDVPWNVSLSYIANYNGTATIPNIAFPYLPPTLHPQITHSASVTGDLNITKNWKITVRSGYDFTNHAASMSEIQIFRDLHCWTMSLDWIPFGPLKSYFFNIHIKASTLQDLKLEKRKEYYDF